MRRFAFATASVIAGGCSLFTDLGGLDEAPTTIVGGPDGSSTGDVVTTTDAGGNDAPSDAGIDSAPITPKYLRAITIANGASESIPAGNSVCTVLAADVVSVAVNAGKMRGDLADLRVYGPNRTEVSRTVDALPSGRAYLCFTLEVAIANGGSATYEMGYGDPNATPGPTNGVFSFVDEFDTVPAGPKWSIRGTPSVTNGRLKLPAGAVTSILTPPGTDGIPLQASIVLSVQITNPTSQALPKDAGNTEDYFFWWFGFQRYGDFAEGEPWMVFIGRDPGSIRAENKQTGASGPCLTTCVDTAYGLNDGKRIYRIDRHANGVVFTYDDGKSFAPSGASGDMAILIRNSLATSDMFVDWVRGRPIVWPEPTVGVGPETTL
jgi:hypothetical protein